MFDLNKYLRETRKQIDNTRFYRNPRIKCSDGFSLSVQASRYHYCAPRLDNLDNYNRVEVGFPSDVEDELLPYQDQPSHNDPKEDVYNRVPVELVEEIINDHGGIK